MNTNFKKILRPWPYEDWTPESDQIKNINICSYLEKSNALKNKRLMSPSGVVV